MKKRLYAFLLALMVSVASLNVLPVSADSDGVKPTKVTAVTKNVTVYKGEKFELKVKMKPSYADDDFLRWKITGKSGIIRFDDDDRTDDEAEFKAVKAGTTKVKCYIKGTKKSVTIKVTVKSNATKSSAIKRVGNKTKRVEIDDDIDLKVSGSAASKYYEWEIEDTSILRFDDKDNIGKKVEVEGIRLGQTKVTCTNTKTNKSITYTIKVIPEVDD